MLVEEQLGPYSGPRNVENRLAKQAAKDKPLDKRQKRAIELLSAGLDPIGVADAVGVTPTTLRVWRTKPRFKQELADSMEIDADLHGVRLKRLYGKALDRVDKLLDDPDPKVQVQAARLAFEAEQNIARALEEQAMLRSLEERMDALAQAGFGGHLPPETIQDAEIISEEPEIDHS